MATRAVKTIDVDASLLAETRDAMKPSAGAADAEVVERALRAYLGRRALDASQAMSGLTEEEALRVANEELHAMRRERRVMRVVIDPGVLVSAFISPKKAAPALLVDAALDGTLDALVCPALIAELTDVLGREKFAKHLTEGRAAVFIAFLVVGVRQALSPRQAKKLKQFSESSHRIEIMTYDDLLARGRQLYASLWHRHPPATTS
jgi:hypothetical protein